MNYLSANEYFRSIFGQKLIKLSIDGGFTCPNRDGTLSFDGCIFCSEKGSGDFTPSEPLSITKQIEVMKKKMSKKWGEGIYMAYFQAFTNTYAPVELLRKKYYEAINCKDVVAISIATRPDCFNDDIYALLSELNEKTKVFVELGLQTSNEQTAKKINRCYENNVYKEVVKELNKRNINVITHIIIGLPFETMSDYENTLKYAIDCGTNGIKLQLLHIIKNTKLASMYENGEFNTLSFEEYVFCIKHLLSILPPNIVVHRLTGDGNHSDLIAPLWSKNKKRVLNAINSDKD